MLFHWLMYSFVVKSDGSKFEGFGFAFPVRQSENILSIKLPIIDIIQKQSLIAAVPLHQLQAGIEISTHRDINKIDPLLLNREPAPKYFDLLG